MPESAPLQRARCAQCLRPARTCLCPWLRATDNRLPLLVLQHPLEQHHAKGSLPLLRLSLSQCRVEVGESFDAQLLRAWLGTGSWLLYPGPGPDAALPASAPAMPLRQLVLLDGTWRKTRKLLHLNPVLQALPRCSLPAAPASVYRIRKSQRSDQQSTLEAACLALGQAEGRAAHYEPLLRSFVAWIDDADARATASGG